MRTILKHALFLLLLATASAVSAQDDDMPAIPEDRMQAIKAQKTAFITQRLDLTPAEAEKFWPVYNQYDKEQEAMQRERREAMRALRADKDLTDAEAADHIERGLAAQQRELDLRKRYSSEFIKLIGARKTLELHRAERDFNRELLRRMRDRHDAPPPPPRR